MNRLFVVCLLFFTGCASRDDSSDLARMMTQEKLKPFQSTPFFEDHQGLRAPPEHTVARDESTADPAKREGLDEKGAELALIPVKLSRDAVLHGRERFEIFCAPCHGIRGDGDSEVAAKMELRKPPSLVDARGRAFASGHVYRAITHGYGLMRSYAPDLTVDERWDVVAYLHALQLAQGTPLDELPPSLRDEAQRRLQ